MNFRALVANNGADTGWIQRKFIIWWKHKRLEHEEKVLETKLVKIYKDLVETYTKLIAAEEVRKTRSKAANIRTRSQLWMYGPEWPESSFIFPWRKRLPTPPKKEMLDEVKRYLAHVTLAGNSSFVQKYGYLTDIKDKRSEGKTSHKTLVPDAIGHVDGIPQDEVMRPDDIPRNIRSGGGNQQKGQQNQGGVRYREVD
jgi:hypothetical protein